MDDKQFKDILRLQSLQRYDLGQHKDLDSPVNLIWIAEINESIAVSVVHTAKGQQGILVPLPLLPAPAMILLRMGTSRPVPLKNWNDPVVQSLKSLTIAPAGWSYTFDGEFYDDLIISLKVKMNGLDISLNIQPNPHDAALRNLIIAILDTAKQISKSAFLIGMSATLNNIPLPKIFG